MKRVPGKTIMDGSFQLSEAQEGGVQEAFNLEMRKLLDNVQDINTPETGKREINIKFTVKPHKGTERAVLDTLWTIESKFQANTSQSKLRTAYFSVGSNKMELRATAEQQPQLNFKTIEGKENGNA